MNKLLVYLSLCLMLFMTGCSEDESPVIPAPEPEETVPQSKTITITVGMPDRSQQSRVSFDDKTLKFTWEDGDRLYVLGYGPQGYIGTSEFTLTAGAGQPSATFTGKTVAGATSYVIYYKTPNISFNYQADARHAATMSYGKQTQDTRHSTAHLKEYLFLQSQQLPAEQFEKGKFGLKMQNCIMRFNIESTPEDLGRIKSVTWENNKGTADAHATSLTLLTTEADGEIGSFGDQGSTTVPFPLAAGIKNEMTVFLCFDPVAMELKPKQSLSVAVEGSLKHYQVDVVADGGMTYKPGSRYRASISVTGGEGHLSNWHEIP